MDFRTFLLDNGLYPPPEIIAGRWCRCPTHDHPKKKNGSYKLAEDGLIGWAKNYVVGDLWTWRPDRIEKTEVPKINYETIKKKQELENKQRIESIKKAVSFFNGSSLLRYGHPYLEKKKLTIDGCNGLRVDKYGSLMIPMFYKNVILSIQRIAPDSTKSFAKGTSTKGLYYWLDRKDAVITILCEGFATGLTLYQSIPNSRVYICFTANNMEHVAKIIKRSGFGCVAADNDHVTFRKIGKNPGIEYAEKAAKILGCGVAVSECIGTDWNDFFCERLQTKCEEKKIVRWGNNEALLIKSVREEIAAMIHSKMSIMHFKQINDPL